MNHWSEYPFVRILFAFLAGVLLNIFTSIHLPAWWLPVSFAITLLLHFFSRNKTVHLHRYVVVIGFSFQCCFFILGNILTSCKIDANDPEHFSHALTESDYFIVKITEPLIEKEKSFKVAATVISSNSKCGFRKNNGATILYLQKDSLAKQLRYGDILLVKNNFQPVPGTKNPDEFDYRNYLWYREIYATAYLRDNDWQLLPQRSINPLYDFTFRLRDISLCAIQKNIPSAREMGVVEALVIGYRDDMDYETQQSYTAAGVVHVLAVSGLHVGILFALLHQLLFFLNRRKHGKIIQSVIIITIVWIFSLLTGLSGSVVRAAAMFSFISIGKNMKRSISINNILACSALFILFINPLLITDVGLQLSYFAVLGIAALSKHFDNLLERENRLVDHVWKTVSMSLAAQLTTLPLTLYFFNQFPLYFLFANLVVIPASGIVLHLGILLIAIQFIPSLAMWIGKATMMITFSMNQFVQHIQLLPFAVIQLPAMQLTQALLMGIIILLLSRFFISSNKIMLYAGLAGILMFAAIQCATSCFQQSQNSVTVYSLRGKSNIEFRKGSSAVFFQSGSLLSVMDSAYLQKHWQLNQIRISARTSMKNSMQFYLDHHLLHDDHLFQFYNFKLAVVDGTGEINGHEKKLSVDAVLLSASPKLKIRDLLKQYETKEIIFDANNSSLQIRKWKQEAEQLGVKVYDVNSEGAFILSI